MQKFSQKRKLMQKQKFLRKRKLMRKCNCQWGLEKKIYIRATNQCSGSVEFLHGSGSVDPFPNITDPRPILVKLK
jgi:hypothetical protein